jgi:hypothetical protein
MNYSGQKYITQKIYYEHRNTWEQKLVYLYIVSSNLLETRSSKALSESLNTS